MGGLCHRIRSDQNNMWGAVGHLLVPSIQCSLIIQIGCDSYSSSDKHFLFTQYASDSVLGNKCLIVNQKGENSCPHKDCALAEEGRENHKSRKKIPDVKYNRDMSGNGPGRAIRCYDCRESSNLCVGFEARKDRRGYWVLAGACSDQGPFSSCQLWERQA